MLRATAACHFWTSVLPKLIWAAVFCTFCLANVLRAKAACNFWTSERPKSVRDSGVLCILSWKLCFAPQRRATFPDRNLKNGSDTEVFWAFWLTNVLRATAACHFSRVCWTAASAPAALARLLFEHQEPRIIEETQRFSAALTFRARVPAFDWLYTRVDLLSADLTSLLCLTPLLCFSTLHILSEVGLLNFLHRWFPYWLLHLCLQLLGIDWEGHAPNNLNTPIKSRTGPHENLAIEPKWTKHHHHEASQTRYSTKHIDTSMHYDKSSVKRPGISKQMEDCICFHSFHL